MKCWILSCCLQNDPDNSLVIFFPKQGDYFTSKPPFLGDSLPEALDP